ncbi:neuroblastoma breakpoint family member 6-like protein [Phyllostomus hastatus]|uniref:neuroblastoma breakpoint family member 6-like protein n=1 Tax=Phyllostomus hastatus TaxID=9423 RepID=UPI001E682F93|nr:neuroblastoma breakpoint family member 6-like protein [Phyllostomus hastatus]
MSILETKQHLCSQLEESKQNFGDITVKFLTCKATAHALARQLQKYKHEECEDLAESVPKEDAPFEEGDLAEKTGAAAWLGKYEDLIQAQARELAHLRRQIQDGKGVCYLFTRQAKTIAKSFESLLGTTDIAYTQGRRFCQQLAQGSQLAESLASKLGPENPNDKKDGDGQKAVAPRCSRGLQKEEVNEVLEDSLDERYLTHSSGHDSPQPPSSDAFLCDMQKASSAVAVARGEIQNLHQHLEEILFINGCLGDKLERHLGMVDEGSSTGGPGCTSNLYREILESAVQLHNENRDIGMENGASWLS